MAPEIFTTEPDVLYGEDQHGTYESQGTPNFTKETDVFAFSMLALEVSNLPYVWIIVVLSEPLREVIDLPVYYVMLSNHCLTTHLCNFSQILTGKLPFFYFRRDTTVVAFVQDGKRPERSRCLPAVFTDPLWALLENCWDQAPERRPSIGSIVEHLERM